MATTLTGGISPLQRMTSLQEVHPTSVEISETGKARRTVVQVLMHPLASVFVTSLPRSTAAVTRTARVSLTENVDSR